MTIADQAPVIDLKSMPTFKDKPLTGVAPDTLDQSTLPITVFYKDIPNMFGMSSGEELASTDNQESDTQSGKFEWPTVQPATDPRQLIWLA